MVLLWACGPAPAVPVHPVPFPSAESVSGEVNIDELVGSLSVRDKIAQLVVPWIPGNYAAYDDEGFARAEAWVETINRETGAHSRLPGFGHGTAPIETLLGLQ